MRYVYVVVRVREISDCDMDGKQVCVCISEEWKPGIVHKITMFLVVFSLYIFRVIV